MRHRRCLLIPMLVSLAATAATAQTRFEITPFVGYRLGGELDDLDFRESFDFEESESYGLVLDFSLGGGRFFEVLWSGQETQLEADGGLFSAERLFDIDIDYWHIGGLYQWERGQVIPLIVGTVGVTDLDPAPSGLDNEIRFSIGFGVGVKLKFSENFGVRLEGRGFSTLVDSDSELFCDPFVCYGYVDNDYLWQFEGRGGLVFAF